MNKDINNNKSFFAEMQRYFQVRKEIDSLKHFCTEKVE